MLIPLFFFHAGKCHMFYSFPISLCIVLPLKMVLLVSSRHVWDAVDSGGTMILFFL